jgi:hypothetical protein
MYSPCTHQNYTTALLNIRCWCDNPRKLRCDKPSPSHRRSHKPHNAQDSTGGWRKRRYIGSLPLDRPSDKPPKHTHETQDRSSHRSRSFADHFVCWCILSGKGSERSANTHKPHSNNTLPRHKGPSSRHNEKCPLAYPRTKPRTAHAPPRTLLSKSLPNKLGLLRTPSHSFHNAQANKSYPHTARCIRTIPQHKHKTPQHRSCSSPQVCPQPPQ